MSAVDVLALMDAAANEDAHGGYEDLAAEMRQARAAVEKLIADRAELLEACRLIVAYDESDDADSVAFMLAYAQALDAARAAIARATGEGNE